MDKKYSEEWQELLYKKEEFEKSSFFYNKLDKEKRQQDLRKALTESNLLEQLSVIRMMGEGYLFPDSIELVLAEVVEIAVTGHEESAGLARIALNYLNMKKWKNKIIQLVILYTEKNLDDKAVFHYSWLLLHNLRFKQALLDYIEKYKTYMEGELDEDDLKDIENMIER